MKKLVMGAIATLFLAGTTFAGVSPKTTKAPAKQETKSEKKETKKTKTAKKTAKGDGKTLTAKPKEEKPK